MADYAHLAVRTRMSDMGYWVVEVSIAPGKIVSIMVAKAGIDPAEAARLALLTSGSIMPRKG